MQNAVKPTQKTSKQNIIKNEKKVFEILEKYINLEAKHIKRELNNNDRVEQLANTESFRNLKDHEPNLYAYP